VTADGYMLRMLKHLATRGSLFLFVRTHQQLQYYFNLNDLRAAANQNGISSGGYDPSAKVIEIHPVVARSRSFNR
jgi:hypothetical protein